MEYPSHYGAKLTNLGSFKQRVDHYAALCLPDFVFRPGQVELAFHPVELEGDVREYPGLFARNPNLPDDQGKLPYLFTEWSRAQLLSRLGASEKWFRHVSVQTQVDELNMRLHSLDKMMVRTLETADAELQPFRAVRGMVSHLYADIPDTDIVNALIEVLGEDTAVIRGISDKTDRAMYIYLLNKNAPIGIPGTVFQGWPGVALRNSEVGYTSLSVRLCLFIPALHRPALLRQYVVLKKVHRGKINELPTLFKDAMKKASSQWQGIAKRMESLRDTKYADQAVAIDALEAVLTKASATRRFIARCAKTYIDAQHTTHNALHLFEAVLASCQVLYADHAFDEATLAGAVLMLLV